MLRNVLLVGLGGAAGSMLRYAMTLFLPVSERAFPWSTFTINLLGCLCIGALAGWAPKSVWLASVGWPLLAVGVCGGFTTFSAFALDGIKLFQSGSGLLAMLYLALSLFLGLLLCYLGFTLTGAAVNG